MFLVRHVEEGARSALLLDASAQVRLPKRPAWPARFGAGVIENK